VKITEKIALLIRKIKNRLLYGNIYYINGSEKLPPPLSKEEEEETSAEDEV